MNCTTYIFGNLKQGYSQYPDDYAKGVFEKMLMLCEDATQIVTHRKNDLMYYAYVRKCPTNSTAIGLCIVFNSLMMEDTSRLFSLYEEVVGKISADGDVLTFSNDGDIIPAVDKLDESVQGQIERMRAYLLEKAVHLEENCVKLPPVSYGVDAEIVKRFSYVDKAEEIAQASCTYNYTCVSKDKDFDNATICKNREQIQEVNAKRVEAEERYRKMVSTSRIMIIIWGSILAVLSYLFGYLVFSGPYSDLKSELYSSEKTLQEVTTYKINAERDIQMTSNTLQDKKAFREEKIKEIRKKIPFLITEVKFGNTDGKGNTETNFGGTLYSSSSMYITPQIKAYGLKNQKTKIDVKIYDAYGMMKQGDSSPIESTYADTIQVRNGEYETFVLKGWGNSSRGHWKRGRYKLEIWSQNKCLSRNYFYIN